MVTAVQALIPEFVAGLAARSTQIEAARRLPDDIAEQLAGIGAYRLLVPRQLGGHEIDPAAFAECLMAIAEADAATAWCAMIGATAAFPAGFMENSGAREIFTDAAGRFAGVFAPTGQAVPDEAGRRYTVTGHWDWASGSANATWLSGGCLIRHAPPADARMMFFPAGEAVLHDTWFSAGLCGTGSGAMSVAAIAVPRERTVSLTTDPPTADGALYRFPAFGLLSVGIAAVALGNAAASIGDLSALAAVKTPQGASRTLIGRASTTKTLEQARIGLASARNRLFDAVGLAWMATQADGRASVAQRAAVRIAAGHATRTCADITREMYFTGGGSAAYLHAPLQRRFRDAHVMTQHMMVSPAAVAAAERAMAGEDVDTALL